MVLPFLPTIARSSILAARVVTCNGIAHDKHRWLGVTTSMAPETVQLLYPVRSLTCEDITLSIDIAPTFHKDLDIPNVLVHVRREKCTYAPLIFSVPHQDPGLYPLRPFAHPDKFWEKIGLRPVPKRTEWGENGGTARSGDRTGSHHYRKATSPNRTWSGSSAVHCN